MRYLKSTLFEELWETIDQHEQNYLRKENFVHECPEMPKHLIYGGRRGRECGCRFNGYDGTDVCSGCEYWA
jgi:hypothetical protein